MQQQPPQLSYHPMQTDQQCGICQTGHTITNPVNLSCCGKSFCAGCINGLLTTKNIYGSTPQCPNCRKKITPTPQLDAVVQKFRQSQLQSKLDGVNSSHIETVLSSDGRSPRSSVEGTKSLRRSPSVCRQKTLTYEHVLRVDISEILLGGYRSAVLMLIILYTSWSPMYSKLFLGLTIA